jgi:exopolyphosphatase / guanosine-5'-triphosphate,3'-diphosphate pyrophosphatase
MELVRVAIIDVGANTLRLLVTAPVGRRLGRAHEEREQLGLGREVERYGYISEEKVGRAAEIAREQTRTARRLGCERVQIVVTSPGRQSANGEEFAVALARAAGVPTRILAAEEEGALAWEGAVSALDEVPETVAVCDVGGGSTQIVVGSREAGPAWVRSVDLGSLRLSERLLRADPPGPAAVEAARAEAEEAFRPVVPPVALLGLGTGGTARALGRVAACGLDGQALGSVLIQLATMKRAKIAKRFGLAPQRASTLLAGTILFIEAQRRLGVPLEPAAGGVREGCALALFRESVSAYASG